MFYFCPLALNQPKQNSMKKMTILHVSTARSWRGGEQQLAYLIKATRAECNCVVLCAQGSPMHQFCIENQIESYTINAASWLLWASARILSKACARIQPDLIHCHDSHAHSLAIWAARLYRNNQAVVVHRRAGFSMHRGFFSVYKYNHPVVAAYIVVSNRVKEILYNGLKTEKRIETIYSGIDLERFNRPEKSRGILKALLGLPTETVLVGNTAALTAEKDYHTFIEVAKYLHQRHPSWKFAIIGDGKLREELQQKIQHSALENVVFMTGFRKDITTLLPDLDVLLMPSRTEGLGTSILDAFASGVAVVATRTGGIPELVTEGITGLLADPGDAEKLARHTEILLTNHDLRRLIVAKAQEKVRQFDYHKMAAKTIKFYSKVLKDNK